MDKIELYEECFVPAEVLEAEVLPTGRRKLVFEAVVSEADHINANNRIYPLGVLWPAFEQVNQALALYPGQVDHPMWGSSISDNGIKWHSFYQEGTTIKGKGEIIWTHRGEDLAANIEAGVAVGFSTRTMARTEDVEIEGRKVKRVLEMDPPFVDAVTTPSVKHARVMGYTREEQETMEKELEEARARITELEGQLGQAQKQLTDAVAAGEQAANEAATKLHEAEERIAELERLTAETAAEKAEAALANRLNELTEGHRFAATLRSQVASLREKGVPVTLENVEGIIETLKAALDAAAPASGEPKGKVESDEDEQEPEEKPEENEDVFTEEKVADLRASGLWHPEPRA